MYNKCEQKIVKLWSFDLIEKGKVKKMKKVFLTILAITVLVMSMSVGSYAYTSTASYASTAPLIDGVIDPIWETTETQNYVDVGDDWVEGDVTAYSKILWDETALYYLVVVTDTTRGPDLASQANDSINLWISETNTKADSFTEDVSDYMYLVASNGMTLKDFGDAAGIEYNPSVYNISLVGFTQTSNGYIAEIKMPYLSKITPEPGYIFGYTFSVNDDSDGDAVRDAYCHSARDTDNGGSETWYWSKTAALGEVMLLAPVESNEDPAPSAPTVTPEAPIVIAPAPSNPTTSDVTVFFYALAAISAVCGFVFTKKR